MKISHKVIPFLAGAALFAGSLTNAATTDPVGYITVDVNANADRRVGVPLRQAPALVASVSSVTSGTVSTAATVPDVTTEPHYIWITSGSLLGDWYEVTGSAANSLTVAEDLETAGLAATDSFAVIPFWRLNTLFSEGGNLPQASSPFAPSSFIQLNDVTLEGIDFVPSKSYFYNDGTILAEGWYENGNVGGGLQNDAVISPESYISVRNGTGSAISLTVTGAVPTATVANVIVERSAGDQDNQISNPFPAGLTLESSNLVADGAVTPSSSPFAPGDLVLVYEAIPTIQDPVADRQFFYNDGTILAEGWYENGNVGGGLQGTYELPTGGAIVIRKKAGTDTVVTWTPPTPYTL
jgi:uncharacterized protein (TIGR02597 family)